MPVQQRNKFRSPGNAAFQFEIMLKRLNDPGATAGLASVSAQYRSNKSRPRRTAETMPAIFVPQHFMDVITALTFVLTTVSWKWKFKWNS